MKSEFDTRWEQRRAAVAASGLIDDARWHEMVAKACSQAVPQEAMPKVAEPTRRLWTAATPMAAAACLALAISIGAFGHTASAQMPSLRQVGYNGQQVSFLCNNDCDADRLIGSLDEYLHRQ